MVGGPGVKTGTSTGVPGVDDGDCDGGGFMMGNLLEDSMGVNGVVEVKTVEGED